MKQSKTIAVIGSTGTTGQAIVRAALAAGYSVRALVRSPEKMKITDPNLELVQGNAEVLEDMITLMTGCIGAISAIGPGYDKEIAKNMISTAATKTVIGAMNALGIKRYVVMTGASVVIKGDRTRSIANLVSRFIFPHLLGDILRDKYFEYELLEASDLDFTAVRCPMVREVGLPSTLKIDTQQHQTLWIEKQDLAAFLVAQIEDETYLRRGIFANSQTGSLFQDLFPGYAEARR